MVTGFDIIGHNEALQEHWIRRVVAIIIDGVIISIIVWALNLLFRAGPWWWASWGLLWWAIAILYFVICEMTIAGSPGKRIMSLEVVGTEGFLSLSSSLIRNISKLAFLVIIDWLVGMFTEGDPRQKYLDRIANTVVRRTDAEAYKEEQFRQMAYVPPHTAHPTPHTSHAPSGAAPPPSSPAPPPSEQPQPGATSWPHQEAPPKSDWPEHEPEKPSPDEEAPRFCQSCGGTLMVSEDGRAICTRCGATY
ncbi:MAG: RDD family protein [Methanobacteriota archaeon]|nr:MAG: RDD family protein [Euryarchaeota archaeon]